MVPAILLCILLEPLGVDDLNLSSESHIEAAYTFHLIYICLQDPSVIVSRLDKVLLSFRILLHKYILGEKGQLKLDRDRGIAGKAEDIHLALAMMAFILPSVCLYLHVADPVDLEDLVCL